MDEGGGGPGRRWGLPDPGRMEAQRPYSGRAEPERQDSHLRAGRLREGGIHRHKEELRSAGSVDARGMVVQVQFNGRLPQLRRPDTLIRRPCRKGRTYTVRIPDLMLRRGVRQALGLGIPGRQRPGHESHRAGREGRDGRIHDRKQGKHKQASRRCALP